MSIDFGAVPSGSVLPVHFGAYNAAGASVTLTGLAVTDVEIYKGTSVTQRSSDAGIVLIDTDGIDIDAITGAHGFSIDTGDNTDSGFYAVGSFFNVWVSAVTIDSQTVNFLAATFRIVAAETIAGTPKADVAAWLGTAASTPTVAGVPNVNAKTWNDLTTVALPLIPTTAGRTLDVSAGGEAGLDWANIGSATTAVNLSATNIDVDQIVASVSGAVGSVTGAVGSVTGAVGSVTGAVGSVTGLTAANLDATISSRASAASLATAQTSIDDLPTNAELTTALGTADDALLTQVALVKTQTDKLTFTVANVLDANVQYVNDVAVTGTGAVGDEWGP